MELVEMIKKSDKLAKELKILKIEYETERKALNLKEAHNLYGRLMFKHKEYLTLQTAELKYLEKIYRNQKKFVDELRVQVKSSLEQWAKIKDLKFLPIKKNME